MLHEIIRAGRVVAKVRNMPRMECSRPFVILLLAVVCGLAALPLLAQTFAPGDVILEGSGPGTLPLTFTYKVLWFDAAGQFKGVLYTQPSLNVPLEVGVGAGGILFLSAQSRVTRLAADGTTSGMSPFVSPSMFTFAADGRVLLSSSPGADRITELNAALQISRTFEPGDTVGGIDLAADQCTLYHTPLGFGQIRRFDICTATPLAPFTAAEPLESYGEIRILPDGLLHRAANMVVRRNAAGAVIRTYPSSAGLALDPDRTSFWTSIGTSLYKIDIATGSIRVGPVAVGNDLLAIRSITVIGEPRAALAGAANVPALSAGVTVLLGAALVLVAVWRMG